MKSFHEWSKRNEHRFRASVYVDIWVPQSGDLEKDRQRAKSKAQKIADFIGRKVGNAYVGGVSTMDEIIGGTDGL